MKLTNEILKNGIYVKDMNVADRMGKTVDETEWEFTTNAYLETFTNGYGESITMIMICGECVCEPVCGVTWKI